MKVSIKSVVHQRLVKLFSDPAYAEFEFISRGFACVEEVEANSILFVGINPSYTQKASPAEEIGEYYQLQQEGNYRYFKKFEEISKSLNLPWSHLDLLCCRETNQKSVEALINSELGRSFILKSLEIGLDAIRASKPHIIVVQNSLARRLLGKDRHEDSKGNLHEVWANLEMQFDPKKGTDVLGNSIPEIKGVPIFFTSMLTGQRALDRGSFERLVWHMNYVLSKSHE